ncbi:MAG: preprotein translocase subunit YajC [Proteobacteria bacterium]|nr:preprotein translocase subunit YajC [Pseudomonadota bacterium]
MKGIIAEAYANAESAVAAAGDTPSQWEVVGMNLLLIGIMVALFYVLLIMPQQKRYKKHREMLNKLDKGSRVLTAAGFIATVDRVVEDKGQVILDLGGGVKVTALRSTIHEKFEE